MQKGIDQLVRAQGFIDREDQYEFVRALPQGQECSRSIVRHKLTSGEFEMRRSLGESQANHISLGVFEHELKARQRVTSIKKVEKLIDAFTTETASFVIIKKQRAESLSRAL